MSKALFLALSLLCFTAQAETKLNFSGDAFVRGYFRNSFGNNGTQANNQFFRLNMDASPDDKLTVKTGLVLSANTWEGDTHTAANNATSSAAAINEDGTGGGDTAHLDHAFIQYSHNGWITSVGRHAVTSPGSFLSSDDRRDRVQVLKFHGTGVWVFIYDKRTEGVLTNKRDDLNMYSVNYYGKNDYFNYALQSGYWSSKTTQTLKDVKQFTPQLTADVFGLNTALYYTFLGGGSDSSFYSKTHHSAALQVAKEFESFKVSYQSIMTVNGGLVASGFDTYSSIVNNSPDHYNSSIKLRTIGLGLGRANADEYLHILKFSTQFTEQLSASLSAGCSEVHVFATNTQEKNRIADASAKYAFSKNLNLTGAYGKFFGDSEDHAGSLTLTAKF